MSILAPNKTKKRGNLKLQPPGSHCNWLVKKKLHIILVTCKKYIIQCAFSSIKTTSIIYWLEFQINSRHINTDL